MKLRGRLQNPNMSENWKNRHTVVCCHNRKGLNSQYWQFKTRDGKTGVLNSIGTTLLLIRIETSSAVFRDIYLTRRAPWKLLGHVYRSIDLSFLWAIWFYNTTLPVALKPPATGTKSHTNNAQHVTQYHGDFNSTSLISNISTTVTEQLWFDNNVTLTQSSGSQILSSVRTWICATHLHISGG